MISGDCKGSFVACGPQVGPRSGPLPPIGVWRSADDDSHRQGCHCEANRGAMLKFDERGLIPAIAQDHLSGQVRMLAYMNLEALERTLATGKATFYSRSRGAL